MTETSAWIARRVREGRERLGWTQAELADRLGHTQTAVSYWESAKRTPGLDDLMNLAQVLHQEFDYFLPPDRARLPVSTVLRAEADRLAIAEVQHAVDGLLKEADASILPRKELHIGATQPSNAANELLEKAGIDHPPVPVDRLATLCGALVIKRSFPDALSGLLLELDQGAVIGVNASHAIVRQRFSVAHELGHHLLGHAERFHIDVTDGQPPGYDYRSERASNEFAADLLMPRRLLSREFPQNPDTPALAQAFAVSELAMGYRLVNLGLR